MIDKQMIVRDCKEFESLSFSPSVSLFFLTDIPLLLTNKTKNNIKVVQNVTRCVLSIIFVYKTYVYIFPFNYLLTNVRTDLPI